MPTQEDIDNQHKLLQAHRRTLAYYLQQQATLGPAFAPPAVMAGIQDCREDIRRVKQILRAWNIDVDDQPDDEPYDNQRIRSAIQRIPAYPYEQFLQTFREALSCKRYDTSGSILHVVFGNIADARGTTVVIPVGQNFDLWQRGERSVLASFDKVTIDNKYFFSAVEEIWPASQRTRHAGVGHTHFLKLPQNSHNLEGVMFVVTTRDLSDNPIHYGRYVNTPIDGIDYTLDKVIECALEEEMQFITMPLLGTGYANISRTWDNPELDMIIRQAVLGLTIHKLEKQLMQPDNKLQRGTVVIYSRQPNSKDETTFWGFLIKFIRLDNQEKLNYINNLVQEAQELDK